MDQHEYSHFVDALSTGDLGKLQLPKVEDRDAMVSPVIRNYVADGVTYTVQYTHDPMGGVIMAIGEGQDPKNMYLSHSAKGKELMAAAFLEGIPPDFEEASELVADRILTRQASLRALSEGTSQK